MASPSTSSSPSSSAVTLPRPGKSILKRPPPPQQSFFSLSRLSRLLPSQAPSPTPPSPNPAAPNAPGETELKRAHFFLPHLVTVYPISSANPPCGPNVKEEKKSIDVREAERRRRIVRGNSYGPGSPETEEWWSPDKVDSFYRECCVGREEEPHAGISAALKVSPAIVYKCRNLLTVYSAMRSDVFALSRLSERQGTAVVLWIFPASSSPPAKPRRYPTCLRWSGAYESSFSRNATSTRACVSRFRPASAMLTRLHAQILKLLLHALLIPGTLNFLSIASNRRLKAPAFRIVGVFMKRVRHALLHVICVLTNLGRPRICSSWTCRRIRWTRSLSSISARL